MQKEHRGEIPVLFLHFSFTLGETIPKRKGMNPRD